MGWSRIVLLMAVIVPFCVLGACSASDDAGSGQSDQPVTGEPASSAGDETSAGTVESADGSASTAEGDEPGSINVAPINQYVGLAFDQEFEAERIEAERKIQDEIAACMQDQGFDYIPQDPTVSGYFADYGARIDADGLREGTLEWTAKYGFGFSTLTFPQDQVGLGLVGYDEEYRRAGLSPNSEYVANLSPEERDAYRAALAGTAEDLKGADFVTAMNGFGCSGAANKKYGLNYAERQVGFLDEFGEEMSVINELTIEHPTVVAAERQVSQCVAERGFDLVDNQTAKADIKPTMQPLYDVANSLAGAEFPDDAKALLADIQRNEIEHAMAIFECGGGATGTYQDAVNDVRNMLHHEFIEDNRQRLDAFILAQG